MKIQGKQYRFSIKRLVGNILTGLGVLMIAWVFISWMDIVAHNLTLQEYLPYNFFTVVFGYNLGDTTILDIMR